MKTIRVDFDTDVWINVPETWPWKGFLNADHWAATLGRVFAEAASASEKEGGELADNLHWIATRRQPGEARFVYMLDPFDFMFYVSVAHTRSKVKKSLDDLVFVDEPSLGRLIELKRVASGHLGDGVRALRHMTGDSGKVGLVAHHAFRREGLDLMIVAISFEIEKLSSALPAVDALATSISVVRRRVLQRTLTREV